MTVRCGETPFKSKNKTCTGLKPVKTRLTRQRRVILEVLRASEVHPTADMLYEMVRQRLPHISLGTVYRNLEILNTLGEIQILEMSGSQKRYDGVARRHYHIRCLNCGRIDNAPIAPLNTLEDSLYGSTVYTIIGHRLEFIGLCPECSRNEQARAKAAQMINMPIEHTASTI